MTPARRRTSTVPGHRTAAVPGQGRRRPRRSGPDSRPRGTPLLLTGEDSGAHP
ncbi:hypothetical protein KPATCC21470_2632 [Kitasatospora purpeofusca]